MTSHEGTSQRMGGKRVAVGEFAYVISAPCLPPLSTAPQGGGGTGIPDTVDLLIMHCLIWEFKGLFNSKFPNRAMHY